MQIYCVAHYQEDTMPKKKIKSRTPITTKKIDQMTIRDWIYSALLLIVVAIMPIVVRFRLIISPPEFYAMYLREAVPDFFSYYKGWAIGIPAVLIVVYAIMERMLGEVDKWDVKALIKSPPVITSAVFLLMAFISTIFSNYRATSWRGTVDRSEGMWILLAYFIVLFAAMYFVRGTKYAKIIVYGLAFSSIVMGLVGLTQFMERDFFMTSFGQWFLRLGMSSDQVAAMLETQPEGVMAPFEMAYGTLYNPNTFGKYTAMVAPVLLACALAYDEGRGWKAMLVRLSFLLGGGLMLVGVFGSRSLGGFTAIAAAIGVVFVTVICRFFYRMKLKKAGLLDESATNTSPQQSTADGKGRSPYVAWALGAGVVVSLILALLFIPVVNQRFELAVTRFDEALRGEPMPPNDMVFDGNSFTFITEGQERFTMVVSQLHEIPGPFSHKLTRDERWHIYDASGQPVPLSRRYAPTAESEHAEYVYAIPGFQSIRILYLPGFIMFRGMIMTLDAMDIYVVAPNESLIDMSQPVPATGFAGREHWGSNRGYIWSRTFPLLPARTIIGSGPDTFTQVFPQHDVVPRMFLFNNPYIPVDKAHNVFLQTWVATGGISALALVVLFGYYLVTTFMSVVRSNMKEGTFLFGLKFGLLAGISAFLVGALSTDSTIGSSGVFYLLLGLGLGVNLLVKRMNKETVSH